MGGNDVAFEDVGVPLADSLFEFVATGKLKDNLLGRREVYDNALE